MGGTARVRPHHPRVVGAASARAPPRGQRARSPHASGIVDRLRPPCLGDADLGALDSAQGTLAVLTASSTTLGSAGERRYLPPMDAYDAANRLLERAARSPPRRALALADQACRRVRAHGGPRDPNLGVALAT